MSQNPRTGGELAPSSGTQTSRAVAMRASSPELLVEPPGVDDSHAETARLMGSDVDDKPPPSGERGDPPSVALLPNELVLVLDGERVSLTRTQFSIFTYFYENAGRWITPNELIRDVLGTHHQPDTSLVRVHVHAIRRRLGRGAIWLESDPRRVRGYRWLGPGIERSEVS
jgi:hypothetical protein